MAAKAKAPVLALDGALIHRFSDYAQGQRFLSALARCVASAAAIAWHKKRFAAFQRGDFCASSMQPGVKRISQKSPHTCHISECRAPENSSRSSPATKAKASLLKNPVRFRQKSRS